LLSTWARGEVEKATSTGKETFVFIKKSSIRPMHHTAPYGAFIAASASSHNGWFITDINDFRSGRMIENKVFWYVISKI
jgi:hypothetical protein